MNKLFSLLSLAAILVAFDTAASTVTPGQFFDSARVDLEALERVPTRLLAQPASADEADRTITITADTKHVNVTHGEVVAFMANGQNFAVRFNGADARSAFDLQRVAPAGALDHPVTAYVAPGEADAD